MGVAQSVVRTPRCCHSRSTISARVRSDSCSTSSNNHAACGSSGERLLPPRRCGLTLPVSSCKLTHRIDEDSLTANRLAAARREHPSATAATTRLRRSSEYGCRPMASLRIRTAMDSQPKPAGNPKPDHNRFIRTGERSSASISPISRPSTASLRGQPADFHLSFSAVGIRRRRSDSRRNVGPYEAHMQTQLCARIVNPSYKAKHSRL